MRWRSLRTPSADTGLRSEQGEEFVRFARRLNPQSDAEQLIRSLPSELSNLVDFHTTALILSRESALSGYVADSEGLAILPEAPREPWQDEICQMISEQSHALIVSPLDQETSFYQAVQFFR